MYVSYTECEWLSAHVLAAANDKGEIILYDEGEITSMMKIGLKTRSIEDAGNIGMSSSSKYFKDDAITVIKALSTGFIAATRFGTLYVYMLDESRNSKGTKATDSSGNGTVKAPGPVSNSIAKVGDRIKLDYEAACPYMLQHQFDFCGSGSVVVSVSPFPDENSAIAFIDGPTSKDTLLISLRSNDSERFSEMLGKFHRINIGASPSASSGDPYYNKNSTSTATSELGSDAREISGLSLFGSYPKGPVTDLALCEGSAIVATISSDKTLRIWNYAEQVCLLAKRFIEDLLSVSVHPDGFRILIGTNRLRMYSITVDDLHLQHEFSTSNCKLCAFSRGGAFFAAASSSIINVYNTYT